MPTVPVTWYFLNVRVSSATLISSVQRAQEADPVRQDDLDLVISRRADQRPALHLAELQIRNARQRVTGQELLQDRADLHRTSLGRLIVAARLVHVDVEL